MAKVRCTECGIIITEEDWNYITQKDSEKEEQQICDCCRDDKKK